MSKEKKCGKCDRKLKTTGLYITQLNLSTGKPLGKAKSQYGCSNPKCRTSLTTI